MGAACWCPWAAVPGLRARTRTARSRSLATTHAAAARPRAPPRAGRTIRASARSSRTSTGTARRTRRTAATRPCTYRTSCPSPAHTGSAAGCSMCRRRLRARVAGYLSLVWKGRTPHVDAGPLPLLCRQDHRSRLRQHAARLLVLGARQAKIVHVLGAAVEPSRLRPAVDSTTTVARLRTADTGQHGTLRRVLSKVHVSDLPDRAQLRNRGHREREKGHYTGSGRHGLGRVRPRARVERGSPGLAPAPAPEEGGGKLRTDSVMLIR